METNEKTDYRKASPEALFEARKVVIRMWKSKKKVEASGIIVAMKQPEASSFYNPAVGLCLNYIKCRQTNRRAKTAKGYGRSPYKKRSPARLFADNKTMIKHIILIF